MREHYDCKTISCSAPSAPIGYYTTPSPSSRLYVVVSVTSFSNSSTILHIKFGEDVESS